MGAQFIETTMHTPVMLSRVADSLYWMSRYLERAKHTARLLNVHFDLMLDQPHGTAEQYRQYLLASLQLPSDYDKTQDDYSLTRWMALDPDNSNSVRACIGVARENARQVREQISSEMWEQMNQIFLFVEQVNIDAMWESTPQEFFQNVKTSIHLFQGLADSTMVHGQGWHFIQAGRFMERSIATAALMDVFFCPEHHLAQSTIDDLQVPKYLLWLGLLRSCTAFEAYCKIYTVELEPRSILEFLGLNAEFPSAPIGGQVACTLICNMRKSMKSPPMIYMPISQASSASVRAFMMPSIKAILPIRLWQIRRLIERVAFQQMPVCSTNSPTEIDQSTN